VLINIDRSLIPRGLEEMNLYAAVDKHRYFRWQTNRNAETGMGLFGLKAVASQMGASVANFMQTERYGAISSTTESSLPALLAAYIKAERKMSVALGIDPHSARPPVDVQNPRLLERVARSAEEAHVFMGLHTCDRCGTPTPGNLPSQLIEREGHLVTRYEGRCPGCGEVRRFELRLDDAIPPTSSDDEVVFGEGRSRLLDAGDWLHVAEICSGPQYRQIAGTNATYALQIAVAAYGEALKFIDAGEAAVDRNAIESRWGREAYERAPEMFRRERIEAARSALQQRLAQR
jgi:hypothetical protein